MPMTKKFLDLVSQGFDEEDAKNIEAGKIEYIGEAVTEDTEDNGDEVIDTSTPIA